MVNTYVIQHGTDGIGHQLHGIFTLMILHDVNSFIFDINVFRNKTFRYEHISALEEQQVTQYIQTICNLFVKDNGQFVKTYNEKQGCKSISDTKPNDNTLYILDNAFRFREIYGINMKLINSNIEKMKNYFINNDLPPNRVGTQSIVVHIRMGDALLYECRRKRIMDLNEKVNKVLIILNNKYPEYVVHVHTDGNHDQIKPLIQNVINIQVHLKNTNIMNVLSDLIHASILVCGSSSLSEFAGFMGNKQLVLYNDPHGDSTHSYPDTFTEMSTYLNHNFGYSVNL